MAVRSGSSGSSVSPRDIERAREILEQVYYDQMRILDGPVTYQLVQLNLEHTDRVRSNAAAIARGDGLDVNVLELAAVLHDVAKLDYRDSQSGGIDTWHHHYRGAALARKILLADLGKHAEVADRIAGMIDAHSDIPFIRRYWEKHYHSALRTPRTLEEKALRDADTIDLLWVGGMSKIIHIRQVPGSDFHKEDGGDIQKAIASAKLSFMEAIKVISTRTGKEMASGRIETVQSFFESLNHVKNLQDFLWIHDEFVRRGLT